MKDIQGLSQSSGDVSWRSEIPRVAKVIRIEGNTKRTRSFGLLTSARNPTNGELLIRDATELFDLEVYLRAEGSEDLPVRNF